MSDQNAVFKAYDVRGRVPEELDEPLAEAIGRAFARLVRRNEPGTDRWLWAAICDQAGCRWPPPSLGAWSPRVSA